MTYSYSTWWTVWKPIFRLGGPSLAWGFPFASFLTRIYVFEHHLAENATFFIHTVYAFANVIRCCAELEGHGLIVITQACGCCHSSSAWSCRHAGRIAIAQVHDRSCRLLYGLSQCACKSCQRIISQQCTAHKTARLTVHKSIAGCWCPPASWCPKLWAYIAYWISQAWYYYMQTVETCHD